MKSVGDRILDEEAAWDSVSNSLLRSARLLAVSRDHGDSRTYGSDSVVAKIRCRVCPLPMGVVPPADEASLLSRSMDGVSYREGDWWSAILMPRASGVPLATVVASSGIRRRLTALGATLRALRRLHRVGVAHGDLRPDNVFVSGHDAVLIDLDRAETGAGLELWKHELRSTSSGTATPKYSLVRLMILTVAPSLTGVKALIERIARRPLSVEPSRTVEADSLDHDGRDDIAQLARAWSIAESSNASSPGRTLAYYAFTYRHTHFRGERPWYLRWEQIRNTVTFEGKSVLEIGCNMGLLSCFALIHGAASAHGIDRDDAIVTAAKYVASALEVPATFAVTDLASPDWERHAGQYDVVFALSVFHWLSPDVQQRLLRFLGAQTEVVYEGHDALEVERGRLIAAGFRNVSVIDQNERGRYLLHATRGRPTD